MDSIQSPKPPWAQSHPKPLLSPELPLTPAPFFNLQETLECDFPTKNDLRFCLLLQTPGLGKHTQHTLACAFLRQFQRQGRPSPDLYVLNILIHQVKP